MNNLYVVQSKVLNKNWAVRAGSIGEATEKVLGFAKPWLLELEAGSPNKDIDVDLKFTLIEDSIIEL